MAVQQERIDEMMRRENISVPNEYMREVEEARRLEEQIRRNNMRELEEERRVEQERLRKNIIGGKRPRTKKGKRKQNRKTKGNKYNYNL